MELSEPANQTKSMSFKVTVNHYRQKMPACCERKEVKIAYFRKVKMIPDLHYGALRFAFDGTKNSLPEMT